MDSLEYLLKIIDKQPSHAYITIEELQYFIKEAIKAKKEGDKLPTHD